MEEARKEVGEILDRLAVIYDEEDVNSPDILREIERLGARLKELIGKTIEECRYFEQYWSYTSLDDGSDYLFWPELIDGLGKNADSETKIKKILEDRK